MSKKVSMEDIARELGITKNTVSLALRDMPGINAATRQLIIDTAKRLGYDYKKNNSVLKNVCLILSKSTTNSTAGFFNYIQYGIEGEAKKQGINVIIYYYDEYIEEFKLPLCIKENMVSGIITLGRVSRQTTNVLLQTKLPLVMVDHYFDNINLNYILTDNTSSGYTATEYLINKGCKSLGFIGNTKASISFYDRYHGFIKAVNDYQLPLHRDHAFNFRSMEELANKDFSLVIKELISSEFRPDGIFCCNDAEALILIKALTSLNIKVPEDVSVIGFDDIEFAQRMTPELTTMRVEKEIMGKKAVTKLCQLMDNGTDPAEKLLLETTLIVRGSVRTV